MNKQQTEMSSHFCCSSDLIEVEGVRVLCSDGRVARVLRGAYYHLMALGQDPHQLNFVEELHDHKGTLQVLFSCHNPRPLIEVAPALAWAWQNVGEESATINVIPYGQSNWPPKERRRLIENFLAAAMLAGDCLNVLLHKEVGNGFCYRHDYWEIHPTQLRWAVRCWEYPGGNFAEGMQRTRALFNELEEQAAGSRV